MFPPSLVVLVGKFFRLLPFIIIHFDCLIFWMTNINILWFFTCGVGWFSDYIWEWWLAGTRFADISLCLTALGNNFIILCVIFLQFFALPLLALFSPMALLRRSMFDFPDSSILRLIFPPQFKIFLLILQALLSCCWYLALNCLTCIFSDCSIFLVRLSFFFFPSFASLFWFFSTIFRRAPV